MTDTYVVSDTGKATITKDPNADLDYPFDWTAWLDAVSDTIASATIIVDDGLTLEDTITQTKIVVAWLSGGTLGNTYRVVCRVVTAGGRTDDRSIFVKIKER